MHFLPLKIRPPFPRPDGTEAYLILREEYAELFQADGWYSQLSACGPAIGNSSNISPVEEAKKILAARLIFLSHFKTQLIEAHRNTGCEIRIPVRELPKTEEVSKEKVAEELRRQETTLSTFYTHVREMAGKLDQDTAELERLDNPLAFASQLEVKKLAKEIYALLDASREEQSIIMNGSAAAFSYRN